MHDIDNNTNVKEFIVISLILTTKIEFADGAFLHVLLETIQNSKRRRIYNKICPFHSMQYSTLWRSVGRIKFFDFLFRNIN